MEFWRDDTKDKVPTSTLKGMLQNKQNKTKQKTYSFTCHLFSGVRWYQELQLRLFCRQVLLDPWQNQPECHFWLTQLLKPWPMVSQAHLLFIFYGPLQPEGKRNCLTLLKNHVSKVCFPLI